MNSLYKNPLYDYEQAFISWFDLDLPDEDVDSYILFSDDDSQRLMLDQSREESTTKEWHLI